jgi:protein subunit release factor A
MPRELIFSASRKDFRLDYFSGTGAGGQYRNKHQNCVRITHIETGLVTTGQTQRSREANQKDAFQKMAKLLVARVLGDQRKERYGAGDERIRTYHEPDDYVKDHESGLQRSYGSVINGRAIDEMIVARRMAMIEKMAAAED